MKALDRILTAGALLAAALVPAGTTAAPRTDDATIERQCRPYFHDACSEAMGRWLPCFAAPSTFRPPAATIARRDHFAYERHVPKLTPHFTFDGPANGTPFVYGTAGPPRGAAVYDSAHRLAFYHQGCCAWHETVLAANAPAPPKRVHEEDLSALRTVRGLELFATRPEVERLYGKTRPVPVPGHPGVTVLAYEAHLPHKTAAYAGCVEDQYLYFRNGKLVIIEFTDAC